MSRPVNVAKRMETLLDKIVMHHSIAMRSFSRHAARPESKTGQLELDRSRKHDEKLSLVINDLKRLVDKA